MNCRKVNAAFLQHITALYHARSTASATLVLPYIGAEHGATVAGLQGRPRGRDQFGHAVVVQVEVSRDQPAHRLLQAGKVRLTFKDARTSQPADAALGNAHITVYAGVDYALSRPMRAEWIPEVTAVLGLVRRGRG